MLRAIKEQLKDYASRGLTTVTDISVTMKSDDTEMTNGMLNILKNVQTVYESESGLARRHCIVLFMDQMTRTPTLNQKQCGVPVLCVLMAIR